jgi:hypothetical protein
MLYWTRRGLSPKSFLAMAAAAAVALFVMVWMWVLTMPLAFLDSEYPSWRAKEMLLASCDLGDLLILGDSRAAAGMMPAAWRIRATNLAVGGGEAIEALAALTRAMRCPHPPGRVILSLDATHFTHADLFWDRTVRFGFVDSREIATLRDVSRALGDLSVYELRHTDGLPSRLRDAMYRVRFPALYFTTLVKGGLLLRWPGNLRTLDAGISSRGNYFFGTDAGSPLVAADGHLREFRPLPILNWYFEHVLDLMAARGIEADFIAMPMNQATASEVDPAVHAAFRAWLAGYEQRYPNFHVLGDVMPHWPNRYFGDGYSHLNPGGAMLFSAGLGLCLDAATLTATCVQRLQDAPPSTQNDAQYGWFSGTVPDASVSVRPSSKRGS